MIAPDPAKRLTIDQVKDHPWTKKDISASKARKGIHDTFGRNNYIDMFGVKFNTDEVKDTTAKEA